MNHHIIRIENVSCAYGKIEALKNISASIPCGSHVAVIGPNGAGKSTLLKAILGWVKPTSGKILLGDDHIHHHHPRLGFVPQRRQLSAAFPTTVRAVVEHGRFRKLGRWKAFQQSDHDQVDQALLEMQLQEVQHRQIDALSGGQKQRVLLARAIAQGADIFLLDEPLEGLDQNATRQLLDSFSLWREQHRTLIAVLHQHQIVAEYFTHVMLINRELVGFGPAKEILTDEYLKRAYGESSLTKEGVSL